MRIIAGSAGGRVLKTPEGRDIRPTSDKVRGAIFNALRSRMDITGAAVIDCFCGSGALGLEALSQGAASCAFIDNNRKSLDLARENAAALGFKEQSSFIFKDAEKLKERFENIPSAKLAFLDPPYNKKLIGPAMESLKAGGWLAQNALCVVESEKSFVFADPAFEPLSEKIYGDTKVLFLKFVQK